jgi:hypothetical protein
MDATASQQDLAEIRNELRQLRTSVDDLRAQLTGKPRAAGELPALPDLQRLLQEGAKAYIRGLTTSPHREGSPEEVWWRCGWQIAMDAVKNSRGSW